MANFDGDNSMTAQLASPSETALELAMRFHEAYERLAPSFGYETRAETRNFGDDPKNANLMVAVCAEILALRPQEAQPVAAELSMSMFASVKDFEDAKRAALAEPSPVAQPVPASPTAGEPQAWMSVESLHRLTRGGNDSRGTVPVHMKRSNTSRIPVWVGTAPPPPAGQAPSAEREA